MSDWIDNDPEAKHQLQVASTLLDQQGTINDLCKKEGDLARALLDMRAEADLATPGDVHTVPVPVHTAAFALATLMRRCNQANPSDPGEWILDRVAAADLSSVLFGRDCCATSVRVDSRTADRAHACLCHLIDRGDVLDIEVAKLAATDLANALNTLDKTST